MVGTGRVGRSWLARVRAPGAALAANALLAVLAPALALPPATAVCPTSKTPETATIAEVMDGDTVRLDDGRVVRLAGIEAPKSPLGWPKREPSPLAEAGRRGLEALVAGRTVAVAFIGGEPDRHGRWHAQVFFGDDGGWLQAALVAAGFARVRGPSGDRSCVAALLAEERTARAGGLGLWANEDHAVRRADDPSLLERNGLYELVEGRVVSVGHGSYMIFIDFGRDYRRDFTIMVSPPVAKRLAEAGIVIDALKHRRLRVRGTIEESGGPAIRLTDPADIEFVDNEGDDG